jgi:2OG-Fe(II) oxygenase superfamily
VLEVVADREREAYSRAQPFPHVVLDGLFPDALLDEVVREAPTADEQANWVRTHDPNALKRGLRDDWTMGPTTRLLLGQFNSAVFINFVERLTGMSGLIPDPHFFGGGIHTIESGGYLRIHADFNQHPRLVLLRRINALLYLNRDWDDEWGGDLELWDRSLSSRVQTIAPIFNRLVIFSITDTSFHGHPNPLETPPGVVRRSLALYYYSAAEKVEPHSTLWQPGVGERIPRPGDAQARVTPVPGELATVNGSASGRSTKQALRDWVPPVVWRAANRFKASRGR